MLHWQQFLLTTVLCDSVSLLFSNIAN